MEIGEIAKDLSQAKKEILIIANDCLLSFSYNRSIFDVGFTTKGVKVGVGLGLSICYIIIVAEHKGNIEVTSELNKGTKVTITIPTAKAYRDAGMV